jgi:hypothetical protein
MQVLVLAVQNAVEARDLGVATAASSFFRSMGGAFGVALFGSIFNNRLDTYLAQRLPGGGGFDIGAVQAGPEVIRALPENVRVEVVEAFAQALQVAFLWGVPLAAACFLVVVFLREQPLRESAHVGLEAVGEDLGVAFETGVDPDAAPELLLAPAPADGRKTTGG